MHSLFHSLNEQLALSWELLQNQVSVNSEEHNRDQNLQPELKSVFLKWTTEKLNFYNEICSLCGRTVKHAP